MMCVPSFIMSTRQWPKKPSEKRLNIDVYFADPYSSWQRGTNENTNGLLREFYPKRFDFSTITQNDLDVVVNIINNRPRKCLGYKTPAEVFVVT